MGTSQMLACLDERLHEVNKNSVLKCFGQEFNPETFAIAKADMLIKGGCPNVEVYPYDLVTGAHVGPGCVAIFYVGENRN